MAKDYARRIRTVPVTHKRNLFIKPTKRRHQFWWRLLIAILIILFLWFAINYWLTAETAESVNPSSPSPVTSSLSSLPPAIADVPSVETVTKQKTPKPAPPVKYEFYKMLPNTTVETTTQPVKATPKRLHYWIQIASLSNRQEAKQLQKSLKQQGFENIKIVSVWRGKKNWHRVQAGPFPDHGAAQRFHDQLQQKEIHSILVKEQ